MADTEDRKPLFDRWAADYDESVSAIARAEGFPFAGYDQVLDRICREAKLEDGMRVLDLGTGTGALAGRLVSHGCRVWGTDLSTEMLARARERIPDAVLIEANLLSLWPVSIDGPFDRIVSAYVLHEFDLAGKMAILSEASSRLAPRGHIVIGDIVFATQADLEEARRRWHDRWDHSEHYWVADDAIEAVRHAGLRGRWIPVSSCAGALVFEPAAT